MRNPPWALLALFLLAALTVLLYRAAIGQTPHHPYHYIYEGWLTSSGASCCSSNDCTGAEGWRFGSTGYEVRISGQWVPVPAEAVRPYASPDGLAHVCVWRGAVRCFVPGSGA